MNMLGGNFQIKVNNTKQSKGNMFLGWPTSFEKLSAVSADLSWLWFGTFSTNIHRIMISRWKHHLFNRKESIVRFVCGVS